jgi:hypothetical protein
MSPWPAPDAEEVVMWILPGVYKRWYVRLSRHSSPYAWSNFNDALMDACWIARNLR